MWEWNDVQWTLKFKNRKLRSTKEKYNNNNNNNNINIIMKMSQIDDHKYIHV